LAGQTQVHLFLLFSFFCSFRRQFMTSVIYIQIYPVIYRYICMSNVGSVLQQFYSILFYFILFSFMLNENCTKQGKCQRNNLLFFLLLLFFFSQPFFFCTVGAEGGGRRDKSQHSILFCTKF